MDLTNAEKVVTMVAVRNEIRRMQDHPEPLKHVMEMLELVEMKFKQEISWRFLT